MEEKTEAAPKEGGFLLPHVGQPGPIAIDQLNDTDRELLAQYAEGRKLVIEVGTFLGGSAEALISRMPQDGRLITIDTYGACTPPTPDIPSPVKLNYVLTRHNDNLSRMNVVVGDSLAMASAFARGVADVVFIDAAHDYKNVLADIKAWLPIVSPDGWLVGHDFDTSCFADLTKVDIEERSHLDWDNQTGVHWGVVRAVDETFSRVDLPGRPESSIWAVRPQWRRND